MDDVVAVRLELADQHTGYVLTWGRIQDRVDPGPLEDLVLAQSSRFALGSPAVRATLCDSLREPAASTDAPHFFEGLLRFSHHQIPYGPGYQDWRSTIDQQMQQGKHLYFCGRSISGDVDSMK